MQDNAVLLKNLASSKERCKKEETETEKLLDVMAAQCNDKRLEKSMNDYQELVKAKERRNQMILKAHNDRTIRNFSTVEHERNGSLEQLFKRNEQLNLRRQAEILDERKRLVEKIKKDVQSQNLEQMQLKRERKREDEIVATVMEGEQVRQHALEYADAENLKKQYKKEQQMRMRKELDELVQVRKEKQLERERNLNMVEFSMNKKSLKELGVINKQTMDLYYNPSLSDLHSPQIQYNN